MPRKSKASKLEEKLNKILEYLQTLEEKVVKLEEENIELKKERDSLEELLNKPQKITTPVPRLEMSQSELESIDPADALILLIKHNWI